jgi:hypothetical protein
VREAANRVFLSAVRVRRLIRRPFPRSRSRPNVQIHTAFEPCYHDQDSRDSPQYEDTCSQEALDQAEHQRRDDLL